MTIIRENSITKINHRRKSSLEPPRMSLKFMLAHSREFCNKTSLHGFKYVTEDGGHWVQSLFWGTFIILGIIFCSILMVLIWSRFSSNPTITAVETVNFPVWKVPFPAVTICDSNKVHAGKIDRIKNMLIANNIPEDRAMQFFRSLALLTNFIDITDTFSDIFEVIARNNLAIDRMMLELAPKCSELLARCTWLGVTIECSKLFRLIKTDEGFCCSFNYYHTNQTYDSEDDAKSEYKVTEIHTAGAGIQTGISVVISINETNYLSPMRTVPSAAIFVHETTNYPEMKTLGTLIKKGELVHVPVEAFVIDTTPDVKTLPYTVRNCTFKNEITLTIGEYGYDNCIIECRMDAVLLLCNCIPYYYNIQNYKNKNVRLCTLADMQCVFKNHRLLYTLSSDESQDNSSFGLRCKCYPFCDINWYTYSVDVGYMDVIHHNELGEITGMHVYFSEFSCMKYKQSNLITWDGLFASFGGIFGLCLGGSILSVVEIIYHFTIRLYVSLKNGHNREKSDEPEEVTNHDFRLIKSVGVHDGLIMPNNYSMFNANLNKQYPLHIKPHLVNKNYGFDNRIHKRY